jgi:hypothetical protein
MQVGMKILEIPKGLYGNRRTGNGVFKGGSLFQIQAQDLPAAFA